MVLSSEGDEKPGQLRTPEERPCSITIYPEGEREVRPFPAQVRFSKRKSVLPPLAAGIKYLHAPARQGRVPERRAIWERFIICCQAAVKGKIARIFDGLIPTAE